MIFSKPGTPRPLPQTSQIAAFNCTKMGDHIDFHSKSESTNNEKPHLVIHQLPSYRLRFQYRLTSSFSLLDPIAAGADAITFHRTHSGSASALLCVGLTPLTKDTLDCLPSLRFVANLCVGVNHIDLSECRRRGIAIANVGDAFSDDVADCAVGLLLDLLRKLFAADRFLRAGSWPLLPGFPLGSTIGGKQIGIVGLGSIGSRVARRLMSFGCTIAYNSRQEKPSVSFPYYTNVYDLALNSDVLILCCSLTNQTHHMINKDVLKALGKNGIVINVGRGSLINEEELVQFLVDGKIEGAGLDVYEDEPNVPTELFGLDNVVLSPHQAVLTPESFKAEDIIVANLEAFISNKPLLL